MKSFLSALSGRSWREQSCRGKERRGWTAEGACPYARTAFNRKDREGVAKGRKEIIDRLPSEICSQKSSI